MLVNYRKAIRDGHRSQFDGSSNKASFTRKLHSAQDKSGLTHHPQGNSATGGEIRIDTVSFRQTDQHDPVELSHIKSDVKSFHVEDEKSSYISIV